MWKKCEGMRGDVANMIAVVCVDTVGVKMSSGKVVVIVIEFAGEVVHVRVVGLNVLSVDAVFLLVLLAMPWVCKYVKCVADGLPFDYCVCLETCHSWLQSYKRI